MELEQAVPSSDVRSREEQVSVSFSFPYTTGATEETDANGVIKNTGGARGLAGAMAPPQHHSYTILCIRKI
jgi:hypothetical protein